MRWKSHGSYSKTKRAREIHAPGPSPQNKKGKWSLLREAVQWMWRHHISTILCKMRSMKRRASDGRRMILRKRKIWRRLGLHFVTETRRWRVMRDLEAHEKMGALAIPTCVLAFLYLESNFSFPSFPFVFVSLLIQILSFSNSFTRNTPEERYMLIRW